MMEESNRLVRFDWAVKRILRDKANFDVLEGFISVLTGQQVKITEILESEGNQDRADAKFNRVDVMARNSNGELIIIEIQLTRQVHYLERILFGVGKALTDHISRGDSYKNVKKVYSISILYFDIGKGDDYAYKGQTIFRGIHSGKVFELSERDRVGLDMKSPEDVFPVYYLICVNQFDDMASTPLDEWLDYLKNDRVRPGTQTPGLKEAAEKLRYLKMNPRERLNYDRYIQSMVDEQECLESAWKEGRAEGRAEGMAEGEAKKEAELVRRMARSGMDAGTIAGITGIAADRVRDILG